MFDALAIARRIKSRLHTVRSGYAKGAISQELDAYVDFLFDGYLFRAYVSPIASGVDPRPKGFDHIVGKRPKIDQLVIAEMASKHVGSMAKVSQDAEDRDDLDPWHKTGIAGFVVRSTFACRFLVEIGEVSFEQQMAEARTGIVISPSAFRDVETDA